MNHATVEESPIRRRPWWQNKYVIYDIVMNVLLIGFNVAAFLYIRRYNIPVVSHKDHMTECFVALYCISSIVGVGIWVYMFKKIPERPFEGGVMNAGHFCGVVLLILFLYSISPIVALIFGIPSLLWIVSFIIYSCHKNKKYRIALNL